MQAVADVAGIAMQEEQHGAVAFRTGQEPAMQADAISAHQLNVLVVQPDALRCAGHVAGGQVEQAVLGEKDQPRHQAIPQAREPQDPEHVDHPPILTLDSASRKPLAGLRGPVQCPERSRWNIPAPCAIRCSPIPTCRASTATRYCAISRATSPRTTPPACSWPRRWIAPWKPSMPPVSSPIHWTWRRSCATSTWIGRR